jgi:hypothetical protein
MKFDDRVGGTGFSLEASNYGAHLTIRMVGVLFKTWLSVEALRWLRGAIDEVLGEKGEKGEK